MKTLFVGGPEDGKRVEWVAPYQYIHTYVRPPFNWAIDQQDTISVQTHTYQLKHFRDEKHDYEIACHSSVKNPMEALIKGYHYHRKPRYGRRRIPKIP